MDDLEERRRTLAEADEAYQNPPRWTHEDVARRAYAIYEARGAQSGRDMQDWAQAERELHDEYARVLRERSPSDPPSPS